MLLKVLGIDDGVGENVPTANLEAVEKHGRVSWYKTYVLYA